MRIGDLIDPFAEAEGPPPQTLGRFFLWALGGSMPVLIVAALASCLAGTLEVVTAMLLGTVIDTALNTGPDQFFSKNAALILGFVAFFLVIRPVVFGFSAAANSIVVGPNINPLVLSRLHRWTLGQAVTFFDDDFAGRIAQKQMQTARALTDVTVESINVVAFALASLVGSGLLLLTIDWRIALALMVWLIVYLAMIRWFMPRVRLRSGARAGARAMVSGQVVDTITNIKTVKLFAHADHEDRAALSAMGLFRERALEFGNVAAWFRLVLMTIGGALPVLLIGGALFLWTQGQATAGNIAAAGAVAIRIAQMTGWVSFALMGIYSSLGEVEDGMLTLTPPHTLTDAEGATELPAGGAIEFDRVSFAYGRGTGGIDTVSLRIEPGAEDRHSGCVGCRKIDAGCAVAASLRSRTGQGLHRRN